MIVLICLCYYCFAIIGFFLRYYFSRFTASDFYDYKSLNRKRRYSIYYHYFVLAYSAFMLVLTKKGILTSTIIVWSVALIIIVYIFFLDFLEVPLKRKKKKWK